MKDVTSTRNTEASPNARTNLLLTKEVEFVFHPDFVRYVPSKDDNRNLERLISDTKGLPVAGGGRSWVSSNMHRCLLTPEEEQLLFRTMNWLKYRANRLRSRLNPERPSESRINELEFLLDRAQRIRTRLAESNLRLVFSLARKAVGGRSFDDLVSDGLLVLLAAIDKFDYSRGFRFSTYATHAIRRFFYRQWQARQRRMERFAPTDPQQIANLGPVAAGDETGDCEVDANFRRLFRTMEHCLDAREHQIVMRRFGLNDTGPAQTLREVAAGLGISKERVRQLQIRALDKLRDRAEELNLGPGSA